MPSNMQLLKQVRNVAATINRTTADPGHKHLLTAADVIFNELMLRDEPDFYLQHFADGRKLLAEGQALLGSRGIKAPKAELCNDLGTDTRSDVINEGIVRLTAELVGIVELLDETRSAEERDFLVRLGDWENGLYHHRLTAVGNTGADDGALTAEKLQDYLRQKFPHWTALKVLSFAPLAGGFSKKTILFETEDALNGRQAMVMRAEQSTNLLAYDGSDVTKEFSCIQFVRRAGLPTAEPLWLEEDAGKLGMRFIVSRRATGSTKGGNMGSDEAVSNKLLQSMLENFFMMHSIRVAPDDPLVQKSHFNEWARFKTVTEATRYCATDFIRRLIRITDIPMTPQLLRCLRWLERNVPTVDEPPVIVHIDYAFNNLIIDNDEVTAILDWESSRLGDPIEDIIWTQSSLAPYLSMEEFLRLYAERTGKVISEYRIAYAKVLKCALNAVTCLSGLHALGKDDQAHPVLATLGLKYMAIFGSQFNALIDDAERIRHAGT